MANINFKLVTPEKTVLSTELASLSVPTTNGQITILPGHAPLVATLVPGELIARQNGNIQSLHVGGGIVQIAGNSTVTVLADVAEHVHEIDVKRAEEAFARAKEMLAEANLSDREYAATAAQLERNLTRIHLARKRAHRQHTPVTSEGVLEE